MFSEHTAPSNLPADADNPSVPESKVFRPPGTAGYWDTSAHGQLAQPVPARRIYQAVRHIVWLYNSSEKSEEKNIRAFTDEYDCTEKLAKEYLTAARRVAVPTVPLTITVQDEDSEETGEDVIRDDHWNYADILWNGMQAEKVQRAFEKLDYREQTLLEKRLAICMACGRVSSWKERPTFERLAVMF